MKSKNKGRKEVNKHKNKNRENPGKMKEIKEERRE